MPPDILHYARPHTPQAHRWPCAGAVIFAFLLSALPLISVVDDWILLSGRLSPIPIGPGLVATVGAAYIAARLWLCPSGIASKCAVLAISIPLIWPISSTLNHYVWYDWFSLNREIAKRVGGAAAIGGFGFAFALHGIRNDVIERREGKGFTSE
jgi:hypothetical protein